MNEREVAFKIIFQFENKKQRLDEIEFFHLSRAKLLIDQMRHLKNLTAGTLRHRTLLDWYSAQLYKGKFSRLILEVRIVLRLGLYEIIFMENIPNHATVNEYVNLIKNLVNQKTSKLVNAVLRSFIREKDELDKRLNVLKNDRLSTIYSFPPWLIKRWIKDWGTDFTEELCKAFNQIPEFTIRVNQTKISVKDFKQILIENEILFSESKKVSGFLKIKQIGRIRELDLFDKGLCSVQDESAGLPVRLLSLKKGDSFLDVCAAPGGKFTQGLEETTGLKHAVAVDENIRRLKRVKENLNRLDLSGYVVAADANNLPFKIKFNKILVDTPCSGQGVIRKHPDIKWRRNAQEIQEFSKLQRQILSNMESFLEKSGQIVYSTCSIDRNENEQVVEANSQRYTLSEISQFEKMKSGNEYLKTFPSTHKMDGSFACLLSIINNKI